MAEEKIKARKRKQETLGVVCIPILHRPEVEIFQPGSSLKGLGFSLKLSAWPSSSRAFSLASYRVFAAFMGQL